MRNALIRMAPCAVFMSALASAQVVPEKATTGATGGTTAAPLVGAGVAVPFATPGGAPTSLNLQSTLGGVPGSPVPTSGAPAVGNAVSPVPGAELAIQTVGSVVPVQTPTAKTAVPAQLPAPGAKQAPHASSMLDTTARGIEQGKKAEALGGDGMFVRRALDRAYDSSMRLGDVGGGAAAGSVAGKFLSAREQVAGLVGVANNSAPADAPGLYGSAIKTAEETLPSAAVAAVTTVVLEFAARKADISLSELVQAAYTAATAGQASETRRLVKSLDKWEELLGAPGRPLIANGGRLKVDVERALAGYNISGAKGTAPRVWVVKRGQSYVAALPGTTVEKVPGLAATFALDIRSVLSMAPMADAYRAFVAAPGARSTLGARLAMGESVPAATLSTGWLWLKYLVMRVWSALTSLLPGRGLPVVANAETLPRLLDAARAWRDAVRLGDAAARAAGSPTLTVSRARGAFSLALRAAAAHEGLTGSAGAVSRVEFLSSEFEAGVARAALSPADRLTSGLATIVSGDGGLRHWASLYASDARERGGRAFAKVRGVNSIVVLADGPGALAAAKLAAASKELSFTAFGDGLWASGASSYGATKVMADLRSTEKGGSVVIETQRGDDKLAAALDQLGFFVTRDGRGLRAKLDAETMSADPREMTELVADAVVLISGMPLKAAPSASSALARLLADMKRAPKGAAKTALLLSASAGLSRAQTVGWVGDDEAVSVENRSAGVRVIAVLDSATGLAKFARIETLRAR